MPFPISDERQRKWERRKDYRPGELLAAALKLFAERGYAATRLDDIARSAGVSKGTLYLYYPSKENLFKAVVRSSIADWLARFQPRVDDGITPSPALLTQFFARGECRQLNAVLCANLWITVPVLNAVWLNAFDPSCMTPPAPPLTELAAMQLAIVHDTLRPGADPLEPIVQSGWEALCKIEATNEASHP